MLALSSVRAGREAYYLATVAAGKEASSRLVEPDGVWLGAAAERLALAGRAVLPGELTALLAGIDPVGGEVLDPAHRRVRVSAFDCTFAPPKSVSVLHGLAPDEVASEVRAAHEASVAGALGYLERQAALVRRNRQGRRESVGAAGLGAASFVHRSSRAGDPHLHSHVLVANLALGPEGRWSALDSRGLFLHAPAAAALYRAELAHHLSGRLGLRVDRFSPCGDLLGIDRRVVLAFSQRRCAIAADLEASGGSSPAARRRAALRTRPDKDLSRSYEELADSWRLRALDLGLPPGRLQELLEWAPPGQRIGSPSQAAPLLPSVATRLAALPLGSLTRRDLIVATCRLLPAGAPVEVVERLTDELLSGSELVADGQVSRRWRTKPSPRRAAVTMPSGPPEACYASPATRELERRWAGWLGGLETAHALPLGAALPTDPALGELGLLERLAAIRVQQSGSGRRLLAVVAGSARALALESLTGLETVPAASRLPGVQGALLLVEERLVRQRPEAAAQVLARAQAGAPVIVVDGTTLRSTAGGRGSASPGGPPGGASRIAVREQVAGTQAVVCGRPSDLLAALLADAKRQEPGRAGIVVPDRRTAALLSGLSGPSGLPGHSGSSGLSGLPGHSGSDVEILLAGDRRAERLQRALLLGGVLAPKGVVDVTRYAVLGDELGAGERRGRLLELVRPPALEAVIGRARRAPDERARWRDRALLESATAWPRRPGSVADRWPEGPRRSGPALGDPVEAVERRRPGPGLGL